MRAVALALLLTGSLILLLPWYDHLVRFIHLSHSDTQLYGGMLLMAGVVTLIIGRARAS